MNRTTKIICTLGPASLQESMIGKMAARGMDVARINASHGDSAQHQLMIDRVKQVNKKSGFDVKILLDLEGYRIRVGRLEENIVLQKKQIVTMSKRKEKTGAHIPFDYKGDLKFIKKGSSIFIDDGKIYLRVMGRAQGKLKCKVIQGGNLTERKGINIPELSLKTNILTQQDKGDLAFAIKNKVDMIAQSFVRDSKDIQRVFDIVRPRLSKCQIIAKIENQEGVLNLDSIVNACDGIMVARGDLGVTMPIYKIPMIQKYIIRHCNRKKKLSMTATQMLDSMIEQGRPTRAEVSDVANAILDGTDYVMLSGETAIGKYPSRSIKIMRQIIEYTEHHQNLSL